MKVLVCGGAGYIGSHTCLALAQRGHEIVVFDNLCNSSSVALGRLESLLGRSIQFIEGDIRSASALRAAFAHRVDAVMHFAALKSVGDSTQKPLSYFDNNICGTVALLQAMEEAAVKQIVFSSSATVYGDGQELPIAESAPLKVTSPYGRTKLVIEQLIHDCFQNVADSGAVMLRYFNPVGAHPSGLIGEDPSGPPNNLMPYITQVAVGSRDQLRIFGSDYPTLDGTGIRDYVHVVDVADAHVLALDYSVTHAGYHVFNIGAGRGLSVLELVKAFESATGCKIPHKFVGRRPGDVAEVWADVSLASSKLGWRPKLGVEQICVDAWRWQTKNPKGYLSCDH